MDITKGMSQKSITFLTVLVLHITHIASQCTFPASWQATWRVSNLATTSFTSDAQTNILSGNPTPISCTSYVLGGSVAGLVPSYWVRVDNSANKCTQTVVPATALNIMVYWTESTVTNVSPEANTDCNVATAYVPPPSIFLKVGAESTCVDFDSLTPGSFQTTYELIPGTVNCQNDATSSTNLNGKELTLNTCYSGTVSSEYPLSGVILTCEGVIADPSLIGGNALGSRVAIYSADISGTIFFYCARVLTTTTNLRISLDTTAHTDGDIICQQTQSEISASDTPELRQIALTLERDDCSRGVCMNGATCTEDLNGYTCQCVPGYTGVNCETDINECASDPCQNSATCLDQVNQYTCECGTNGEFSGDNCETRNPCFSDPCQNGGTCTRVDNDNFQCECPADQTGTLCETKLYCASNPCQNGATCSEDFPNDTFQCTCPDAFIGTNCETAKFCVGAPDTLDPCRDGTERCDEEERKCICKAGFSGSLCDLAIVCGSGDDNPCMNGGTCAQASDGTAVCTCANGYTGTTCETEILPCDSDPCQNGATCSNVGTDTFQCSCDSGFTGNNCEEVIPSCPAQSCENGATCNEAAGTCTCPPGYQGTLCDEQCAVASDCPGGEQTTTTQAQSGSTTSGDNGGNINNGDGDGDFDYLPVIAASSVIGGLILLAGFLWCICCIARSKEPERQIKYPPPTSLAPAPIIAPAFVGAAAPSFIPSIQPAPQFVTAPSIMTAAPYIEQPMGTMRSGAMYYDDQFDVISFR